MAQKWIKFNSSLERDPRVTLMSRKCNATVTTILGALAIMWFRADEFAGENGELSGLSCPEELDAMVQIPGFAEALPSDWLVFTDSGAKFPNYLQHNGTTAKTRALNSARQGRHRNAKVTPKRDKRVNRGEERRRDKIRSDTSTLTSIKYEYPKPLNTPAFKKAWQNWISYRKEIKKPYKSDRSIKTALNRLAKYGEAMALDAIDASIANGWQGLFPEKLISKSQRNDFDELDKIIRGSENGQEPDGETFEADFEHVA